MEFGGGAGRHHTSWWERKIGAKQKPEAGRKADTQSKGMLRPTCMHAEYTGYISAEELRILQETDPTLGVVRKAVNKESRNGVSL